MKILITGLKVDRTYYDKDIDFDSKIIVQQSISGSITFDFVSCGNLQVFIDDLDEYKRAEFEAKIAEVFLPLLSKEILLSQPIELNYGF